MEEFKDDTVRRVKFSKSHLTARVGGNGEGPSMQVNSNSGSSLHALKQAYEYALKWLILARSTPMKRDLKEFVDRERRQYLGELLITPELTRGFWDGSHARVGSLSPSRALSRQPRAVATLYFLRTAFAEYTQETASSVLP